MGWFDIVLVQPIFNLLLAIYAVVGDFGVAVIIFTVVVKFLMWPLMKRQLHQTKLMKKLQPELAEIKKNCKGNRQMESLQMMALYKKYSVKPFSQILTMVIQIPVFIALWRVVQMMMEGSESIANYAYGFMKNIGLVSGMIDGSRDIAPRLFGFVDMTEKAGFGSISAIIILVIVLASAWLQRVLAKQQMPKKEKKKGFKEIMKDAAGGKQADQTELNNMVSGQMANIMPIMMLFVMIGLPGAVVLYYLVTNLMTVVQQKYIFGKDEDEMEMMADKKVLKELRDIEKIQEGKVVEKKVGEKQKGKGENVTRIVAGDKKRRKKK